jgi:hypothetical protein
MRAFQNSGRLAALLATLLAVPASAQIGPPIRLDPPQGYPPPGYPPPPPYSAPGPAHAPLPYDAPPPSYPSTPRVSPGITVDSLAPLTPDSIGALGPGDRGLPESMWQGTPRATVEALLPRIGTTGSPTLQDLAYRLLASAAMPPAGSGDGSLLALRAERLTNALGRADTARSLLEALPPERRGEDLVKISVDLAFLSGDRGAACRQIRARDRSWRNPYWDQGLVTCQALDDSGTEAQLGVDMLREAKVKDDGFGALVERALGNDAKLPDALPAPQPMALALLDKAGLPVPRKAFESARLPVLVAVATGTGFPPEQRVLAAEKAAALGGLAPEVLAETYLALTLDQDDLDSPLSQADAAGGVKARAILFRAAHDATAYQSKANFLAALLAKSPRGDVYPAVIRAARPMLLDLPASTDMATTAPDFARALYALDQPGEAAQWLAVAGSAGASVLPLAHIAADREAPDWGEASFAELTDGGSKKDTGGAKRAALVVQLLTAEGHPVPDTLVMSLLDAHLGGAGTTGPGLMIDSEAAGRHLGGTVLAVLAALGDEGAGAPSQTVAQAVVALREIGLKEEARHLAIDAAVAAGL